MSLSSAVRISPAALDSSLIYSVVGGGLVLLVGFCPKPAMVVVRGYEIEFTVLRMTLS